VSKLLFFRQKRFDGTIHTGLELDDEPIAHRYEGGSGERDPALLWYVDLRCEGPGIPDDPELSAHWLLEHGSSIRDGFAGFARKLEVGADPDLYSLTWGGFPEEPEGVTMTIACSAARRVEARELSRILGDIAGRWDELIRKLEIPQSAEDFR